MRPATAPSGRLRATASRTTARDGPWLVLVSLLMTLLVGTGGKSRSEAQVAVAVARLAPVPARGPAVLG